MNRRDAHPITPAPLAFVSAWSSMLPIMALGFRVRESVRSGMAVRATGDDTSYYNAVMATAFILGTGHS